MLVLALGATLVGFVLLVGALFSGLLWLAIACIVVCVIGVGFLIADLLGIGRSAGDPAGDGTGDDDARADEVRDRSAESDLEEGPESRQPEGDNEVTGRMPRISRDGDQDPPTEEIRFDRPS
ncbi:hypothetical protein [Gordonia rubripertincta]|uniref:Uncharacterized protein n=1 Tax=Gordonia rubripertincta TaxID=36822 RepID=A0ABT4MQ23_GORRU|nr:hypothetical protein [Gordonia rubripertincta]MCZ4549108.1 hypothetical protein [Gordonia rubripertincta]